MRKDGRLDDRMLDIPINGVSTRRYEHVLPEMADAAGVSKSQISRETIEAGERLLKELAERDFSKLDVLAVWIDGIQIGSYHVIRAVGEDADGHKHVLGIRDRVRRVRNRQSGSMALRWTAAAFDAVSKGFRRIMGYKLLWMLKAALDEPSKDKELVDRAKAG